MSTRRAILVTGGSSGIGADIVRLASHRGFAVFIGYKKGVDRAQNIAHEIQRWDGKAFPVALCLDDPNSIDAALDVVARNGLDLEALVLCASPAPVLAPFVKVQKREFLDQFQVNVVSAHRLIAQCWRRFFSKNRRGHVIGLLSAAIGPPPSALLCSYIAAKRALQAVLECAAVELGPRGLRVNALSPSYTETPMLEAFPEPMLEMARAKRKSGRFLTSTEVAVHVVNCLESPEPSEIFVSVQE